MGTIEKLYDNNLSNEHFLRHAKFAFSEITKRPIDSSIHIMINRLFSLYGRKGVISALVTLDVAMMSDNFTPKGNLYPFLVYGAKKAFESHISSSQNLEDIAKKISKRRRI